MEADCRCRGPVHTGGLMQEPAPHQPSFYRRQLPSPPAIDFASDEGKDIFSQALASGTLAGFFPLIAQFQTQAEPAYCGLASLSVTLNALSVDPKRPWKGPWRWFDEALLDCCEPLEKVKLEGIVFRKLACLARCQGVEVRHVLASNGSEIGFREEVRRAATGGNAHVIVGYSRKEFLQTGDGHFSPVGGYHAARDLVLILDVARFKYPPHWVPLSLLWKAMNRVDKVTGESRGYLVLTPRAQPAAALFSLARPDPKWAAVADYAAAGAAAVLRAAADVSTAEQALCAVLEQLPDDVTHLLTWMCAAASAGEDAQVPRNGQLAEGVKDQVLKQLRSCRLFGLVSKWVATQSEQPLDTRIEKPIKNTAARENGGLEDASIEDATSGPARGVVGRNEGVALKRKRAAGFVTETEQLAEAEPVAEAEGVTQAEAGLEAERQSETESVSETGAVTVTEADAEADAEAEAKAEMAAEAEVEAEAELEVEKETEKEAEAETDSPTETGTEMVPETVRPVKRTRVGPSDGPGFLPDKLGPSDAVALDDVDPVQEVRMLSGTGTDSDGNGIAGLAPEEDRPAEMSAVDGPTRVDLLVVLLLVCPGEVWAAARDANVREELQSLTNTCCMESPLQNEVAHLKEQFKALRSDWAGESAPGE